ncbi:MAG: M16 family metallopeptidase [Clostridia bacterium]
MAKRKIFKYKDGGTILYIPSKRHDSTVMTGFFAGSLDNEKNGVAHLLEHSLFLTTQNRDKDTLQRDIQSIVPSLNAGTGASRIYLDFFRTNKMLDKSLALTSEMLFQTKLQADLVDKEKGVIAEEYNESNDRRTRDIYHYHSKIIFKDGEICPLELSLGTPKDIDSITIDDLNDYRKKNFTRQDYFFAIITKLPFRKVKKLVDTHFISQLPQASGEPKELDKKYSFDGTPQLQVVTNNQDMISIMVSFKGQGGYEDSRYDTKHRMINAYFNGNNGVLFTALRDQGLVYSAGLEVDRENHDKLYSFHIRTSKDKIAPALVSLAKVLGKVKKKGFDKEVFEHIKQNFIHGMDEDTPSFHINKLRGVVSTYCQYGTLKTLKDKTIRRLILDTTIEDITAEYNAVFHKDNLPFITILGNVKPEEVHTYKEMCDFVKSQLK